MPKNAGKMHGPRPPAGLIPLCAFLVVTTTEKAHGGGALYSMQETQPSTSVPSSAI